MNNLKYLRYRCGRAAHVIVVYNENEVQIVHLVPAKLHVYYE